MFSLWGLNPTEAWMLIGVGVVSGILELIAIIKPDWAPMISPTMRINGQKWVLWPYIMGGLPGHLWNPTWLDFAVLRPYRPYVFVAVTFGMLVFDVLGPRVSVNQAFLIAVASLFFMATFWR